MIDREVRAAVGVATTPAAEVDVLADTLAATLRLGGCQLCNRDTEAVSLLLDPLRAVGEHVRVLVPLRRAPFRERAELDLDRHRVRVRRRPRLVAGFHVLADGVDLVVRTRMARDLIGGVREPVAERLDRRRALGSMHHYDSYTRALATRVTGTRQPDPVQCHRPLPPVLARICLVSAKMPTGPPTALAAA